MTAKDFWHVQLICRALMMTAFKPWLFLLESIKSRCLFNWISSYTTTRPCGNCIFFCVATTTSAVILLFHVTPLANQLLTSEQSKNSSSVFTRAFDLVWFAWRWRQRAAKNNIASVTKTKRTRPLMCKWQGEIY